MVPLIQIQQTHTEHKTKYLLVHREDVVRGVLEDRP